MIGKLINLKQLIFFLTFNLIINCQFIYNPYGFGFTGYIERPPVVYSSGIPVTVPGHNGRTPFINNGAGFYIQSAALLNNNNNIVNPPTRIMSIPSLISPFSTFKSCKYGKIC
ncbi:Hypothetical protein SRAE_2000229600 [Strongyloides ratti]|uniref:Uncharacterized protein n=1 Tax=Strongyloides ratti TaxID=34506 RepID=A0A090LJB3_STRRB|nr:Hypothetical protein SRAE_2000229600 [Strongyloides ratti]CEF67635.1 Hypothetical protein SRAE_2000229600 [Strongyloides ratti]